MNPPDTKSVSPNKPGAGAMQGLLDRLADPESGCTPAEEALRRLERAVETMHIGVTITDVEGTIVYTNPADAAMHGYAVEELMGQNIGCLAASDHRARMSMDQLVEIRVWEREGMDQRKDGTTFPVLLISDVVTGPEGPVAVVTTCGNLTERKRAEQQLIADSLHDGLTGLPNRALLIHHIERSLGRVRRQGDYQFAVVVLALDRFKAVNDTLGRALADQLLKAVARRLGACLRPTDAFARLSGDEYAILVDDLHDVHGATRVAGRMRDLLNAPFMLNENEVFTSVSVGIALGNPGYDQPDDLLRDADLALRRAKEDGKSGYAVFDPEMHRRAMAFLRLETDLRRAIERQEFRTHYQPIVSLDTGRIIGVEALLRWQHPLRGLLPPVEFLAVAEDTGLITPIGWWILRDACAQMTEWQSQFDPQLTLSVNLSGRQFMQPDTVEQIERVLEESGLDAQTLMLEMTETVLMGDEEPVLRVLARLKALNVQLHMDDFGTGYASLSYLHRFPIDTLKIDQSFVGNLGILPKAAEIIRSILALAASLGLRVVAEGVETAEQESQLKMLQCHQAQGTYFSEPIEGKAMSTLLRDNRPLS